MASGGGDKERRRKIIAFVFEIQSRFKDVPMHFMASLVRVKEHGEWGGREWLSTWPVGQRGTRNPQFIRALFTI